MEPSPLPDLDVARALRAMEDDREIYEEVLDAYLLSVPALFSELETARQSNDLQTVKRCAHSIKSSSRTIGGMRTGAAAEELEMCAETLSPGAIAAYSREIQTCYVALCRALAAEGFATG